MTIGRQNKVLQFWFCDIWIFRIVILTKCIYFSISVKQDFARCYCWHQRISVDDRILIVTFTVCMFPTSYDLQLSSMIQYTAYVSVGPTESKLWMTLNPSNLRSWKLDIKYFENGDRYDNVATGSRIGNQSTNTMIFDLGWPWAVLGLIWVIMVTQLSHYFNISNTARVMMLYSKDIGKEIKHGHSIFTMNFDHRWPWNLSVHGH